VNHTRFPREDHLPDWVCQDKHGIKGDRVDYKHKCHHKTCKYNNLFWLVICICTKILNFIESQHVIRVLVLLSTCMLSAYEHGYTLLNWSRIHSTGVSLCHLLPLLITTTKPTNKHKELVNKTNRRTEFRIYRYYYSTSFGQPFRPSSGVRSRTSAPGSKRSSKLHEMYQCWCTATNSWWWGERLPETCIVIIPINWSTVHLLVLFTRNLSRCMVIQS
jgi:hypothetical protein